MAITTQDQLAAALRSAVTLQYNRTDLTATPNTYPARMSSWVMFTNGWPPKGVLNINQTFGPTSNPGPPPLTATLKPGNSWYLAGMTVAANGTNPNVAITLCDRYGSAVWISGAGTSGNAVTWSRTTAPDMVNTMAWLEYASATAATANITATLNYTNTDGLAGRTATMATLLGGTNAVATGSVLGQTFGPFNLQAGDRGIQSVQSLTTSAGGSLSVVVGRPLLTVDVSASAGETQLGWHDTGLINLGSQFCFYWMIDWRSGFDLPTGLSATVTLVQG